MAEKPFIAARLRNPAEAKPRAATVKTDWIGGVCAIVAFLLAAAVTTFLFLEWQILTQYIGR